MLSSHGGGSAQKETEALRGSTTPLKPHFRTEQALTTSRHKGFPSVRTGTCLG